MTTETYEIEHRTGVLQAPGTRDPFHNPSYPRRDHFSERSKLEAAVRTCEARVEAARQKLEAGGEPPERAKRLYHQLLGIRDQIAECARRIPLETGELYAEDEERFKQATAALERVWRRWEQAQQA